MSSLIEASSSSTLLTSKNDFFRKHLLFILTVGSVFMGFILGLILRSQHLDQKHIDLIGNRYRIYSNIRTVSNIIEGQFLAPKIGFEGGFKQEYNPKTGLEK